MAEEIIIEVSEGTQEIVVENAWYGQAPITDEFGIVLTDEFGNILTTEESMAVTGLVVVEESGAMAEIIVENVMIAEVIVEDQLPAAEIVVEYGATIIYSGGGNPGFGFEKYAYLDGLISMIEIFEDDTEAVLLYTQNFTYNINGNVQQIVTIRESDSAVVSTEDFEYDLNGDLLSYYKY